MKKTWNHLKKVEGKYHIWEEDIPEGENQIWVKISHHKKPPTKRERDSWKNPTSEKGAYKFSSREGAEGFINTIIENKKRKNEEAEE